VVAQSDVRPGLTACSVAVLAGVLNARAPLEPARTRYETERAIVEFDAGALTPAEMQGFARLLDQGIADLEAVLGSATSERRRSGGAIRYVVSARARIAMTFGRTVHLPLERVRTRSAPYLHETAHVLLPARCQDCLWLVEGFASYLESWVSENRGGYDAHVFSRAGDRGIHQAAAALLSGAEGRAVLPYVGRRGEPPGLMDERRRVARPFYVLSHSFAKFLVERAGLERVVLLFDDSAPLDALARATGRGAESWRRGWLEAIGAGDLAGLAVGPTAEAALPPA
jgi:hypothetical protein